MATRRSCLVPFACALLANPPYDWWDGWGPKVEELQRLGDFWVFSWPAGDFGGTMVVHARTGKLVYSATTVWSGTG